MALPLPPSLTTRDGQILTVRRLTPDDAAKLQQFNDDLSDTTRGKFLPHAYDDPTVAQALARNAADQDLLLGLFDGGRMVGYFFLWYFDRPTPLLGIGLLDAFQGSGLGKSMMQVLIDAARATDREGVELTTLPENDRAFALYQAVGFTYRGDVENVVGDGSVVTERAMFYEIKPGARGFEGEHAPPV